MKRILLSLVTLFFLYSCEKNTYVEETAELPRVIEITADFTPSNNYSFLYTLPTNMVVYESDIILVYLEEQVVNGNESVWTLLPQSFFSDLGTFQYSYNHTYYDINLMMYGNFNLQLLPTNLTLGQRFRIAVLPAAYAAEHPEALSNMNALMRDAQTQINF
jgi:hypothetical protein